VRLLLAPQEFKGTLSAREVAQALERGVRSALPQAHCDLAPISDGGPGLVEVVLSALPGELRVSRVTGPLGAPVEAGWAHLRHGLAVIEMAAASGLRWVPEPSSRSVMRATTRGVGELMVAALDAGARELWVGAGGSATNDGGAGALAALGARFLDAQGRAIAEGPEALCELASVDLSRLHPGVRGARFTVLTDVVNPLLGRDGATRVFGAQKGAGLTDMERLESALTRLREVVAGALGRDRSGEAGMGAAGGLAFGLSVLGATVRPGFEQVAEWAKLPARIEAADVVVTGEGKFDGQTGFGKGPLGVALLARRLARPCVILAGRMEAETSGVFAEGVEVTPRSAGFPLEPEEARGFVERAASEWARRYFGL
jgi:glycerate 2-kinase